MPYLERMIKAHDSRPELFPPGTGMYVDFEIRHDDWCPVLTQPDKVAAKLHEACECAADITFELNGRRYRVSLQGNVFQIGESSAPSPRG